MGKQKFNVGQTNGIGFRADLGNSSQTGITSATQTKINFTIEVFDDGGFFDASSARWTPPAGLVQLNATAILKGSIAVGSDKAAVTIYKNGSPLVNAFMPEGVTNAAICSIVSVIEKANGTDYYEAFAYIVLSSGTGTVEGNKINSHFSGACL